MIGRDFDSVSEGRASCQTCLDHVRHNISVEVPARDLLKLTQLFSFPLLSQAVDGGEASLALRDMRPSLC